MSDTTTASNEHHAAAAGGSSGAGRAAGDPAGTPTATGLSATPRRHRPAGILTRLGTMAGLGNADILRVALSRDVEQRRDRLVAAARDRRAERRRPTRPTMRSLHLVAPGRFEWREIPVPPPPGPTGATVRPIAVATCDLDGAMAMGATPFPLPLAFGHECVAEVLTVGDDVRSVRPGQRVIVPFQVSCGSCAACRAGLTSNCTAVPPLAMYGFGLAGGHWGGVVADQLAVPFADGMLVPLPDGVDAVTAASVADNVCDGYRHVGPYLPRILERDPDADVLILGALGRIPFSGSIGIYAGQVALALGARRVRIVDHRADVRHLAARLGMTPVEPSDLPHVAPAPLVMSNSGTARGLRIAFDKTAPDGVCSNAGALVHSARVPVATAYARNLTYHVGRTNARAVIPEVLDLITAGRIHPEQVVSTRGPMEDAVAVLDHHVHTDDVKAVLTA